MAPTATFLAVDLWASVVVAIVASSVVAVMLVFERHWRGVRVGWVLPATLGYVVVRGLASVAKLGISLWEASHLRDTSSAEFVAIRSFVGWPIMAFVVFWLIFYVRARLDPVEHRLRSAMAYDSSVGG